METLENNLIGNNKITKERIVSFSKKFIQLLAKPLLLCVGLTLAACGGGGGNSSSASGVVTYAGNTNQATIDSAIAEDIANSYFKIM